MLRHVGATITVLILIPSQALATILDRRHIHVAVKKKDANTCLTFMHIPKTGGTTMDLINLRYERGHRPYRSYMEDVYDRISQKKHKNASDLFDHSHSTGNIKYRTFMAFNADAYKWYSMPDGKYCTVHTPPSEPHAKAFFEDDQCTVFCSVRDPLERFVSTFQFDRDLLNVEHLGTLSCTPKAFSRWAVNFVKGTLHKWPDAMACHWLTQAEMIYGTAFPSNTTMQKRYCQRVLRYENLEPEFDALMQEFGRSVRLDDVPRKMSGSCKIDLREVTREAKDAIYEYYRVDYDLFGYAMP